MAVWNDFKDLGEVNALMKIFQFFFLRDLLLSGDLSSQ